MDNSPAEEGKLRAWIQIDEGRGTDVGAKENPQ
jgi:hypothetical protein